MARHLRNPKIESRAVRAKLKPSLKPTYFGLGGKLHLGYRRGKGPGVWVARVYVGDERYITKTIAEADDLADANGGTVLNFAEAEIKAREWAADRDKAERLAALGPVITVKIAIREYLEERSTAIEARAKLKHLAPLAEKPLAELTVDDLKAWRASLTDMSESSKRRVCNDARAALNSAAARHEKKLPATIYNTIRKGFAVRKGKVENTREKQILTDADVKRLIAAAQKIDGEQKWGGDLERLIVVLAATGARFSQVARLRVADLQVEQQRLMMPTSMKGGVEKKITHTAIPLGADVIAALEPITRGRKGTDLLLTRPFWRRAPGPGLGVLEVYEPAGQWSPSGTLTRVWKDIVERAGLPEGTIIYALRHSSIVRGLRAGLPTQMVAKLHDTSSAMLEEYYTAFITDALDALARAALVPMMPTPVSPLRVVEG